MPVHLTDANNAIGSVIYSSIDTGDMKINFFSANKIDNANTSKQDLPYQPPAQEWTFEYPLMAYKHYSPSDDTICIINVARNEPRKCISLD